MAWFRRRRVELQKAGLDDISRRLTKTVELAEQRLEEKLRPRPSRDGVAAGVAGVIAVISGFASYGLYSWGQSGTPTADAPGTIAVAILGDAGSSVPLQVTGNFFVDSSKLQLFVTDLTDRTDPRHPPQIVVYLCGAARVNAKVSDPNRGDLELKQLPSSPIEMDSRLGERRECSYAVAEFNYGFQAFVDVSTQRRDPATSGANVVYRIPGITTPPTLPTDEKLDGSTVHPLTRDSEINVSLVRLPDDLTITSSRPQIPASGQASWSYAVADPDLPETYRVSGFLGDAQRAAQTRIFIAGALVGVCGAAILWFLEALIQGAGERPRSKSD